MNWRVKLNDTDITAYCSGVQTRFEADAICGEVEVALAYRAPIAGLVVPRVPQSLSIAVDEHNGVAWVSRGQFFLEEIGYPQELDAKTATLWGRTLSAKLTTPWAQKVSKQWATGETIASIIAEVVNPLGVTFSLANDYDVCQYCYAVSDQTPAEIIRDIATRSGQTIWPQVDGSIVIAPRIYDYGMPDAVLSSDEIIVESLDRQVPDFGNRILVSGDAAVAGISVLVVPLADEDACVVADGHSTVRVLAVITGADGQPVALGTVVTWSASSGLMAAETSQTAYVVRQNEVHKADSYTQVTLDLPAASVIGVYARADVRKARNIYVERSGSVSGRIITFAASLDFFDQAVVVDYNVAGAPNTWTSGWVPGDVTVLASVSGAQGFVTLHQSNPSACSSSVTLEASPANPCLGDVVSILLKTTMFGGAGVGSATFGLVGCGQLSSTNKILQPRIITETLRTTVWGGAAEVRLTAMPVPGTVPSVVLTETPGGDLYSAHSGQTVILTDNSLLSGTQVTVTYTAGGTALIAWKPTSLPSGYETINEILQVTHSGEAPDTVAQVTLSRTPVEAPTAIPSMKISDFYASHDGKIVTLLKDNGNLLPIGTYVSCLYQSVWLSQPGCSAVITVNVQDGSEDGGRGQLSITARDCRTVNTTDYDPDDENQIPDDNPNDGLTGDDDPTSWLEPEEDEGTPAGCNAASINARTPIINPQNANEVYGVPNVENCPGVCTCDQICDGLRSTGRLMNEGGMTYSVCVSNCNKTRQDKCTGCSLTGPAVLNPGQDGTWTDGKTNSGEWSGGLPLKSRTFEGGYVATMPTGGSGPFTVKVCYGEDERTCCEAEVDFPPCSLTGPTKLATGQEGEYVPSLGMTGATAVVSNMTYRTTETAFIAKLNSGACSGTITVSYGGRVCGAITVANTMADVVGVVAGPPAMNKGGTAYFTHNLTAATYIGTLQVISQSGEGAILKMPDNADGNYTAAWAGMCGVIASMTVEVTDCVYGSVGGVGAFPGTGALVLDISRRYVYKIGGFGYTYSYWAGCESDSRPLWGIHENGYLYHIIQPCVLAVYDYTIMCNL